MKTKQLIEYLRCCYKGKCDKCTLKMKSDCINDLLFAAAEKLSKNEVEINNQRCEIEAPRKELAEREATPGWISAEERMPEESGYYLAYDCRGNLFICLYQANGLWDSSSVDYWMPLPEPPKKTYKDVFLKAFPKAKRTSMGPRVCRYVVFGGEVPCDGKDCKYCWNQPYEEEGGAE